MSPSGKASKKPAVPLSKVPPVRELCERLGFRHAPLKESNSFLDATHTWRKSYKTSNGTSGTELLLWNEVSVQLDLTIMAERFLEDKGNRQWLGNGERFWSFTSWSQDSDVQYPDDRQQIIELLKQLFWKQNRYAANNNAYGHKGSDSRNGSQVETTPTHQDAEMEGKTLPTPQPHPDSAFQLQAGGDAVENPPFLAHVKAATQSHVTDHSMEVPQQPAGKDVYDVSDDDSNSTKVAGTSPKSPVLPSKHVKAKRSTTTRETTHRKRMKFSLEESRRRTDRKRVRPDRPGIVSYASDDLYEEIMKTPPPNQEPPLTPEVDEPFKVSLDKQKASFEGPLVQETVPMKPYAAPTAPMMVPVQTDPSTSPLTSSSRVTNNPESASKSQVNSSSPQNQQPKVIRLRMKTPKSRKHPPGVLRSSVQTTVPPGVYRSEGTSPLISPTDAAVPPASCSSDPVLQTTPATAVSGLDTTSRGPQLADEADHHLPPKHNTSIRTPEDQNYSKATTEEIEMNEKCLDTPERLGMEQTSGNSSAEKTASKVRTKAQVPLWIITREPRYTEERWIGGKFQGVQLSDFLQEVSRATQREHIEKLKLTLQTPSSDTKITVFKGDEDEWTAAKKTFVEKLKEAMVEAKSKGSSESASFKIFVEPFCEKISMMASNVDEDDVEFDF